MAKKKKKISIYYKISRRIYGLTLVVIGIALLGAVCFYSPYDSSFNYAGEKISNLLGTFGAYSADFILTFLGVSLPIFLVVVCVWGFALCCLQPLTHAFF